MERPKTPPRRDATTATSRRPPTPPTPEVTRRIEENRLRAKAIRDQHEAAARAAGTSTLPHKSDSGFVATDNIHVVGARDNGNSRKRPFSSLAAADGAGPTTRSSSRAVPASNRDARGAAQTTTAGSSKAGEEAPLRPAKKFAKYVGYNLSAMTDTKGGFLAVEDDPHNYALNSGSRAAAPDEPEKPAHMTAAEWERKQLLRRLQRQKAGPYEPGMSTLTGTKERKKCRDCGSLEIDFVWDEVFGIGVCGGCKEKYPEKYSLLTKTECKQDYLLTDRKSMPALTVFTCSPLMPMETLTDCSSCPTGGVEEYALGPKKWGSAEALDAEFERRESDKRRRKESKFKEKLADLKRRTRTDAYRRENTKAGLRDAGGTKARRFGDKIGDGGEHVHDWGRAVENEEGMSVKTCMDCGMEVEELEL
uniref:DNA repair protein RAD14 n=1 Tax=Pyricularia oryzae (strain P131) TaxID=1143193 RepID=L7JEQ2_PYRO1